MRVQYHSTKDFGRGGSHVALRAHLLVRIFGTLRAEEGQSNEVVIPAQIPVVYGAAVSILPLCLPCNQLQDRRSWRWRAITGNGDAHPLRGLGS